MFSIWLCFIFGCVLFGCFCVFVYCVCETTGQDVQRGITQRPTNMVYIKVRLLNRDSFRNRRVTAVSLCGVYRCRWHGCNTAARCSSVVRTFAHGAMGRRIDPSWGGPIELFLFPASAPRLV